MDNHDGADQELVEKGKSGPSEKSPQAQINGTMAEPWWKRKIAGRVPVWSIGLIGVVVVIAAVIGIATSLSGAKPGKPKLKITDKVTFVIGNEDGDTLGDLTIGVFGDILSKTRENFISLAKKEVDGEEIDYGYLGSRFSNEEDYVITAGIFGGNEKGKAIYDAGEHGKFYFSRKFEDFVWEDLTKYNKENLTSCCLREGYVAMLKNPDTEGDDGQAAFDSQFVIYKEDITWDDGDLKQNLIFGKVIDEESSKGILEKLNGPGRLIIKNIKDIKEDIKEESIDKPKTLELTN